jgi:preprotein translocase subunit SecE
MARNRKRAKERRDRRPQPVAGRSRVAAGPAEADMGMPSPLEHAAPDVELAEAQLALGRADELDDGAPELTADDEPQAAGDGGAGAGVRVGAGFDGGDSGGPPSGGGSVALPGGAAVPEPRPRPRARLIGFLEGSWRELQRVQWPDRRQVMQATAVVIGFVVVAGVFLGVADTLAQHLMSYIITGTRSVLAWVAIGVIVLSLAGWMLADRDR